MEIVLRNPYIEVAKILEVLGDSYKNKLPLKIRQLFEEYKDKDYDLNIDANTKIEDIKVSRNTLVILGILNLKYWEQDPNKKEELKKKYENNEIEFQEKINAYKQEDWLKHRENFNNVQIEECKEMSLIEQENLSIFAEIKRFFINLFHNKG